MGWRFPGPTLREVCSPLIEEDLAPLVPEHNMAALGLITVLYDQRRRASVQTQTTVVGDAGPTSRSDEG